jgi:phosphoribosylanthranilate isomerase
MMQVKICGITKLDQARAIAQLGATALGFICVPGTPRYIAPQQIRTIVDSLAVSIDLVGVFLNASIDEIINTVKVSNLNWVQLHGNEDPEFCHALHQVLPETNTIKALRIRTDEDLEKASLYEQWVDMLLLDAYHPQQAGGTGQTIDWTLLNQFRPRCPWFLAGGLNPDNILDALNLVTPDGIDLSSGLENAPGDKNLERVAQLFEKLRI